MASRSGTGLPVLGGEFIAAELFGILHARMCSLARAGACVVSGHTPAARVGRVGAGGADPGLTVPKSVKSV